MISHSRFNSLCAAAALGFAALAAATLAVGQNCPDNPGVRTICKQIGDAEVVSVSGPFGAYPTMPPTVYWRDSEWWIDVLPKRAEDGKIRIQIKSRSGETGIVELDEVFFAQVDSITRNPRDKAIVLGEANGTSSTFSILDLKTGKEISGGLLYDPSISPDRRFLLYENWFPPHAEFPQESQYILYDTFKSPQENVCGYESSNPEYLRHRDELNGMQVYPYQTSCLIGNDENDDNAAVSAFAWTTDSSKVVFADIKDNVISLILVAMPDDRRDRDDEDRDRKERIGKNEHGMDRDRGHRPQTSVYTFTGADDVCAGAKYCDNNNVKSVAWNGNSVNVALIKANPSGKAIEKDLTIPLSKFVPVANSAASSPDDAQSKTR